MNSVTTTRASMAVVGMLAGLSLYALFEALEAGALGGLPALGVAAFATGFLAALLALWGPLPLARAAVGAGVTALLAAGLLMLAAMRYLMPEAVLDDRFAALAYFATLLIPLPFWIAGPRNYPGLFGQAWGIVMRYASALVFVGVAWLLLLLSDALLGIVDITVIDAAIDKEPVPWGLTGLMLGLGIAVANELSDHVPARMALRLLRLLVPVVLVVMAVFIVALPLRGLSGLLGSLSIAATLLGMCLAAVTLVTAAIDRQDAADGGLLPARALAAIVPVPAALALWSVWLRVAEYGWTPSRVFAALAAGVAIAYGLVYLAAVLRGARWRQHIRQGNIALAGLVVALAALWQTPLLDATAISAASQMHRIEGSDAPIDAAAMQDWGRAGDAALADLRRRAETDDALRLRMAGRGEQPVLPEDLAAVLPVRPEDQAPLRERIIAGMDTYDRAAIYRDCVDGACVMIAARFWPEAEGMQALILTGKDYPQIMGYSVVDGVVERKDAMWMGGWQDFDTAQAIRDVLARGVTAVPVPQNQIELLGRGITLQR